MGDAAGEFPLTSWGMIAGVQGGAADARRAALEKLCGRYWKPVYGYVRRKWSKGAEDAQDLVQAFFLWLIEGDALRRYEPSKAGFRAYLKMLLRGFAADEHDAAMALKRGGGAGLRGVRPRRARRAADVLRARRAAGAYGGAGAQPSLRGARAASGGDPRGARADGGGRERARGRVE